MKYVIHVTRMRLSDRAASTLSKNHYDETNKWLDQWTCKANIQAVLCDTLEQGLTAIRESFNIPWFIKADASCFEFEISYQEVKDNRFWIDSGLILCKWYNLEG